jgi:hypothetical protein
LSSWWKFGEAERIKENNIQVKKKMASIYGNESRMQLRQDNLLMGGGMVEEIFDNGMQPAYITLNVLCILT